VPIARVGDAHRYVGHWRRRPTLDDHQRAVFDAVVERGENVFVTGSAGCGKSFTVRAIVAQLRALGKRVHVASSTGRSAVELQLDATTLHGYLALGDTGDRPASFYVKRLEGKPLADFAERIRSTDVLVIDEISMVSAELLAKAETIVAATRQRRDEPWGGVQLVVSGDFAQLRPVPDRRRAFGQERPPPQLAFYAVRAWRDANIVMYQLRVLHRQSADAAYGELLNRIRFASVTADDINVLRSRIITREQARALESSAVFLFARNADVDEYNRSRLESFDAGTTHVYRATTSITVRDKAKQPAATIRETAKKFVAESMRTLPELELRVGARVMLLANLDVANGLANGCTGTVLEFDDETGEPLVDFDNRPSAPRHIGPYTWRFEGELEWKGTYEQLPLVLAWATSIHKSQGLTLKTIVMDGSPRACFAAGMAYVGPSRTTTLDGLHYSAFSSAAIFTDAEVLRFYTQSSMGANRHTLPPSSSSSSSLTLTTHTNV